jgi:hypothetical protein
MTLKFNQEWKTEAMASFIDGVGTYGIAQVIHKDSNSLTFEAGEAESEIILKRFNQHYSAEITPTTPNWENTDIARLVGKIGR